MLSNVNNYIFLLGFQVLEWLACDSLAVVFC